MIQGKRPAFAGYALALVTVGQFPIRLAGGRFMVGKIHTLQGGIHMQFPRNAIEALAVPIENAISRISIFLNLKNHRTGAQRMQAAVGNHNGFTSARG